MSRPILVMKAAKKFGPSRPEASLLEKNPNFVQELELGKLYDIGYRRINYFTYTATNTVYCGANKTKTVLTFLSGRYKIYIPINKMMSYNSVE